MLDKPSDMVFLLIVSFFLLFPTVPFLLVWGSLAPATSVLFWVILLALPAAGIACIALAVAAWVRYRRAPAPAESRLKLPDGRAVPTKDGIASLWIIALVLPSFMFLGVGEALSGVSGPMAFVLLFSLAFAPSILVAIEAQRRYTLRKRAGLPGW